MQFKIGDKVRVPTSGHNNWRLEYCEPNEILTISSYADSNCCWVYSKKKGKEHHVFYNILLTVISENKIGGEIL